MRAKYPWSIWQNGEKHTVDPEDFNSYPDSLRTAIYKRAKKDDLFVFATIESQSGLVTFQFADTADQLSKPKRISERWADGTIKRVKERALKPHEICKVCQTRLPGSAMMYGQCIERVEGRATAKHGGELEVISNIRILPK